MNQNIFSALAKYNLATENYLTEAFVFVLQSLYKTDRDIFLKIIDRICVKNKEYSFSADEKVVITTQKSIERNRPDVQITTPDKLVFIEVKYESQPGHDQIERYLQLLEKSHFKIRKLILLTRFSIDFSEQHAKPYKHIRWFEIHKLLSNVKPSNTISRYLLTSFLKFLEEKKMIVKKINWEYINGVPAFKNLMNMLEVAIEATPLKISSKSAGWDWMGFYIDNKRYFCGVYYDSPLELKFEIYKDGKTIKSYSLDFEDIYFFSLNQDKQLAEIVNFINNCHNEAKNLI